jgi:undecaprenyl-diphosphatase
MLLSVPAITGAGLLVGYEMYQTGNSNLVYAASGVGYSFIASLLAIWIMMSWLKTRTFLPFVIYRVALGLFLLLHGYGLI